MWPSRCVIEQYNEHQQSSSTVAALLLAMPTYGTSQQNGGSHTTRGTADDGERATLLGKPKGHAVMHKLSDHLTAKLDKDWADLILLLCYVITGLLDSTAVFIYGCFVSMQTGTKCQRLAYLC